MFFAIHWHESAMDLHVFPIPMPPPASLSIPSLWVIPVHQPWAFVSCIQPGLVICFTLDSILVSILFSLNIPPSPSPTESKSLERVWRKGNPLTLLVGMQTSTATMENSVEILKKTGNRSAIWPSNPTPGHTHQGNQIWKRHVYPNVHHSTVYNSQDMEAT